MTTQQEPEATDGRDKTDRRRETASRYEADEPLPRDPQNQQAEHGEDPLAIPVPDWPDSEAPAPDAAGTGRRGDADEAKHTHIEVDEPVD
ncbi:hypothetical protein [Streptomyces sp. NBC_00691]|uniref:hypothetical protein n=1 Tax=Streptomyces sp. NBC_00691 TaxID=2903671 RepID=UPI002E3693E8|nr:hypothetical protein [Streptomyces sp. NBC_00691]